jgi:hypothetical protein
VLVGANGFWIVLVKCNECGWVLFSAAHFANRRGGLAGVAAGLLPAGLRITYIW